VGRRLRAEVESIVPGKNLIPIGEDLNGQPGYTVYTDTCFRQKRTGIFRQGNGARSIIEIDCRLGRDERRTPQLLFRSPTPYHHARIMRLVAERNQQIRDSGSDEAASGPAAGTFGNRNLSEMLRAQSVSVH
jgi:hypothetical protein